MKKILFSKLLLVYCISFIYAEEPDSLFLNANAIILNYNTELNILNQSKAIVKIDELVTILNENGDKHGVFAEYYDKFRNIKSFHGEILNSNNETIKKIKLRDLNDRSLISNFSLYEDNRIKFYEPEQKKYPYYIHYTYEIEYNSLLNLPSWQPINSSNLALKRGSLKVTTSKNDSIRYISYNINTPDVELSNDEKIYYWEIDNMKGRENEPLRLSYSLTTPCVKLAPYHFEIEGYAGKMDSWEEFGKWRYSLIKGQGNLPVEAINDIANLTKEVEDDLDKARIIYNYMQSRTRYVSIQEGIGGWKPFDATTVHNLGYGDCKALTNYTKALMACAGIKSYYAVVKAGLDEHKILTDFPSNQFNHVILCLPIENDTVWLECTSQTAPFGYLGDFTGNKYALLIKKDGGELVKTTQYLKENNTQKRFIKVSLLKNGITDAIIRTTYKGLQYENISYYGEKGKEEQKELLLKKLDISNFEIKDFSINVNKKINPVAKDSIHVQIKNYVTTSSSRLFFNLNMLNKNTYVPRKLEKRISPVRFTYPYTDIDSIEYIIPEGYDIEYLPKPVHLGGQFGDYSVEIKTSDDKITYVRKLSMNSDVFPAESYDKLTSFFEEIVKHDKAKCILKKKI